MSELEKAGIGVESVLDTIFDLPAAQKDLHRDFLMKFEKHFDECQHIRCVFHKLNTYWNYLNGDILAHLITKFSIMSLYVHWNEYEKQLEDFLERTILMDYYEIEGYKQKRKAPQGFIDLVTEHTWKQPIFLKDVDNFRKELAREYDLHTCAVILVSMEIGSVVITMVVPESFVATVNSTRLEFFMEHSTVHLYLNNVYYQASV